MPSLRGGLEGEESVDSHHSAGVLTLGVGPVPGVIVSLGHIPAVLWTTNRQAGALTPATDNIKISLNSKVEEPGKVEKPGRCAVILGGDLVSQMGQLALVLPPGELGLAWLVVQVDQLVDVVVNDILVGEISFNLDFCQLPGEIIKPARGHNKRTYIYLWNESEALDTVRITLVLQ